MNFTIDDAIEEIRDRVRLSELHHMPVSTRQWTQIAIWLERLRDASEHIEAAVMNLEIDYAPPQAEDTIYDMRERQRKRTIKQVCEILEGLSETTEEEHV